MPDFQSYWSDLRRGVAPPLTPDSIDLVSTEVLHRWSRDTGNVLRPSFVVASGENRHTLYRKVQADERMFDEPGASLDLRGTTSSSWVYGLSNYITDWFRTLPIPPEFRDKSTFTVSLPPRGDHFEWEMLWGLAGLSYLVMNDPLDAMVDQRFSMLSDAHRGLLEARFLREPSISSAIGPLGRWVAGLKHSEMSREDHSFLHRARIVQAATKLERFELLHFYLTLAKQNGLLGSAVLLLDGLENLTSPEVAEDLSAFLQISDLWVRYGSPLGVLVGWRGTKEDTKELRKLHPLLARKITDADKWLRSSK
jgi:hypothetical protein